MEWVTGEIGQTNISSPIRHVLDICRHHWDVVSRCDPVLWGDVVIARRFRESRDRIVGVRDTEITALVGNEVG
jgi:hypothetical protein